MKPSLNLLPENKFVYKNYIRKCVHKGYTELEFVNKPLKQNKFIQKISSLFQSKDKTIRIVSKDDFKHLSDSAKSCFSIKNGMTFGCADMTYVNNNGKLEALNMTPELFNEFFPPHMPKTAKQGERLGDCWLVSTINGLMQKPNGRIAIYRKFGQDWSNMYVKLPDNDVFFPESKILESKKHYQLSGPKGLQMLEQAIALDKGGSFTKNFHQAADVLGFHNIMKFLDGGSQTSALWLINPKLKPKVVGLEKTNKQMSLIKKHANKDNYFLGIMTTKDQEEQEVLNQFGKSFSGELMPMHAFNIAGYDKVSNTVKIQDPMIPEDLICMPADELKKYPFTLTVCKL